MTPVNCLAAVHSNSSYYVLGNSTLSRLQALCTQRVRIIAVSAALRYSQLVAETPSPKWKSGRVRSRPAKVGGREHATPTNTQEAVMRSRTVRSIAHRQHDIRGPVCLPVCCSDPESDPEMILHSLVGPLFLGDTLQLRTHSSTAYR